MRITEIEDQTDSFSFVRILILVWKRKWLCLSIGTVFAILAAGGSLLLPNTYKAELSFISQSAASSSGASQLAGLAQLAGLTLGGASGSDALEVRTLLASRMLREMVVDSLKLERAYFPSGPLPVDARRKAVASLKGAIKVSPGKNGESILEVEFGDPKTAVLIAEQLVASLEDFLSQYNLDRARKSAITLEKQIHEQSDRVRKSQEALVAFQVKYRALSPDSRLSGNEQIINGLYSQKVQLEVELRLATERYQGNSSRVQDLRYQIQSIDGQIQDAQQFGGLSGIGFKDAPDKYIEYQNLLREVEISQKLYTALLASFEQTKISSTEEKVVVQVIDPPLLPDTRSSPNRGQIVLFAGLLGIFVTVTGLVLFEMGRTMRRQYLSTLTGRTDRGGVAET